ncbi:MAG: hypothetical protein Q9169_006282 [Polycauliona sp. 2 TL-2023]
MQRFVSSLSLAAALLSAACHGLPSASAQPVDQSMNLHPIKLGDYESALGLHRRAEDDFSSLDPGSQTQLIYGRPGDDGQLLFANMTLYAPSGLPIVLMERFEGLTSAVDCKGDDGHMSLTFTSKGAYDYALKIWSYINEDDSQQFLMIANHDGCGPADERQPYKVSSVTEDAADLTISMRTSVTEWSEVAGSYDLDFGRLVPQARKLKPRGFWGDIVNVGKDVLDAATGDFDETKSVTFPLNIGSPGEKTLIYKDEQGRFSLDCVDCYVTGDWQVQGRIVVDNFVLQDLTLSVSPSNFKAKLELEATVTASKSPVKLQSSKEIFAAPIPAAGIAITGIFKLGATFSYEVGTSVTIAGTATARFGLEAGLPNNAIVVADINNPSQSSADGWSGGSVTPTFQVTKLDASLTLAAFSQPKIAFGIDLIKVAKAEVALTMKLPEISSTLSATYDPNGVCPEKSTSVTGVKLENKATESLTLSVELDLLDKNPKIPFSKPLFEFPQPLGDACFPIPIPGLGPADSPTPPDPPAGGSAPKTCKPPSGSGICQKDNIACPGGAYVSGLCPGTAADIRCCPSAPATPAAPKTCKPPSGSGICQKDNIACPGGAYISNLCPDTAADIRCCPSAAAPTPPKTCKPPSGSGICQKDSIACPGGAYVSNLCPDTAADIRCCPAAAEKPSCSPPSGKGVCQKDSIACPGGAYVSGLCPGGADVRCCPVKAAPVGSCKMRRDRFGKRILAC